MTNSELNRSNIQALFRYMPDQPYNWSTVAATVIGRPPRQTSALDVPEDWAKPQLLRLIAPFAPARDGAPPPPEVEAIERTRFALVKAEDLQAIRFPNTYLCKICARFQSVRPGTAAPRCGEHGPMDQFPWTEVHECGHLKEITPPNCGNNCRAPMALENTRAFSTTRWYWRCTRCRRQSDQPIARYCGTCRTGRSELIRLPQSRAHYPQYITLINPPTRNDYRALSNPLIHRAAVAQSLGVVDPGLEGLRQAVEGAGSVKDPMEELTRFAKLFETSPDDPMFAEVRARAEAMVAGTAPTEAWNERVDALGRSREDIEALGDECLQYSLARSAHELTSQELLEDYLGTEFEPRYTGYSKLFEDYGLSEVTLLRELPMALVVAGYTRQNSTAVRTTKRGDTPVTFRFFEPGRDSKFPMYGVRTETEGLLFQLDRVKLVHWLMAAGVADEEAIVTEEEAQHWMLRRMAPVKDLFSMPDDPVTRAVLGLVHSFAHRAMKSLASRCGLNVDSLAEFLFPAQGAFLVYANTRSEFTLGGLEHVYRYDLKDALTELDAESRCLFDPPCRNFPDGAACAACLHVSEVACARFNTVLDRNMLFGTVAGLDGTNNGGRVAWRAYWNR